MGTSTLPTCICLVGTVPSRPRGAAIVLTSRKRFGKFSRRRPFAVNDPPFGASLPPSLAIVPSKAGICTRQSDSVSGIVDPDNIDGDPLMDGHMKMAEKVNFLKNMVGALLTFLAIPIPWSLSVLP